MSKLYIRPLNTGYVGINPRQYLYHYTILKYRKDILANKTETPVFAFLVQGGSSLLLVDTGMSWTEHAQTHHFQRAVQPSGLAIHEQLGKLDLHPEDIDVVILTHLHWDHSFYLDKFTKAEIYVHKKEYAFAMNPLPLYYKAYEHPILGIRRPFEGIRLRTLFGEAKIMPGVSVLETPGHSPGHMSIIIETETGEFICAGDSLLGPGNLASIPELHFDISPPGIFCNILEAWNSIELQKTRLADASFALCCHDQTLEERIKISPVLGRR